MRNVALGDIYSIIILRLNSQLHEYGEMDTLYGGSILFCIRVFGRMSDLVATVGDPIAPSVARGMARIYVTAGVDCLDI